MEIKISTDELRQRRLFVAAPMYGGQCAGMFTRSIADLSALCTNYGIQLQFYFLFNESLITRARNYCADEFLRSNATHMMFIDSDIGFSAQDVVAMLALMGPNDGYDVMCGPYPKKCISWEKIKQAVDKGVADRDPNVLERYVGDYVFNPMSGQNEIPLNQPVEVREGGTGFMMIKRSTFETLEKAYPSLSYKPDHVRTEAFDGSREIHAYFDCVIDRGYTFDDVHRLMEDLASDKGGETINDVKQRAQKMLEAEKTASKRYLSEDYMFCYYSQKAGLKVWLNPWMKLQHVGSYVFGGSLADLASIGASATADVEKLKKK